ncbi:unnamed protein product [Cuscuta epithymum]|uniref:DYW domain-containing protein n=1 Tax=Cuscuta epithymum TaxID=186058 RepID=A0AAV0CCV6_9ASTE|nr:unnamed protein product [Cuscuta epithymum]
MSFQVLGSTSVAQPPPPLPPSLVSRSRIPAHAYTQPTILLELCISTKELRQMLPVAIKNGLYNDHLFQTKLLSLFSKFGSFNDAFKVFESVSSSKPDALYHTMLRAYTSHSSLESCVSFYSRMRSDNVDPVVHDYAYLIKACAQSSDIRKGKQIHGQLILNGFSSNLFAMTGVVNLYVKCGLLEDALRLFERMSERDLVAWNTVIAGFTQNRMPKRTLEVLLRMHRETSHRPDLITVVSILPACAAIGSLRIGKSVHCYVLRNGLVSSANVSTALVDMYGKCDSVSAARLVFDKMDLRTVVSWNAMIDGYAQSGNSNEALVLFENMLNEGLKPTNVTVMAALHACAESGNIEFGRNIHEMIDQLGLWADSSVVNTLISMYSKCKRADIAYGLFEITTRKTLVTWNAMILGFAQSGQVLEAIDLFCKMQLQNIKPDSFTLVSVATALAELSVLRQAKWIHGLAIRTCLDKSMFVVTALVDMYAKCGAVSTARKLFDIMDDDREVIIWNAMIDGYGTHGFGMKAIELFEEMPKRSIRPNDITFLCIISACSHSGFVEKGKHYFKIMKKEYGIKPLMDHYGAMVDLLGRAGRLDEAWDFINNIPVKPEVNVFGAMLGACKIHKNVELGEKVADKLFELEPDDGGYYVLLANIYASASLWKKVAQVRILMEKKGIRKAPGCSLVDLRNEVHTFYSGSTAHPLSKQIYAYLETLIERIKAAGYIPNTDSFHDVEDDVQEKLVSTHSEKLAIAFALINTSHGTTINIRKNLRVCGDCHTATKFISLVTQREIVVRDMHRFHHFKNGTCSCGDYW